MIELIINHTTKSTKQTVNLMPTEARREFLIGRFPNSDVFIDDPFVSRYHAKLINKDNQYFVSDQASSCGTKLHDQSLAPMVMYPLTQGSLIRLGPCILEVVQLAQDRPSQPTEIGGDHDAETVPAQNKEEAKPKSDKWSNLEVTCVRTVEETEDVKTFYFQAENHQFNYKPGQFATLHLDINNDPEDPVDRSYSISSSPSRPNTLEITIKRVPAPRDVPDAPPGLVSNWMHDNVKAGTKILLSGPLGKFTCADHPAKKLLFISAGSGVTPMMSMSRWILDKALDRDIVFFHAARGVRDIIYSQELEWMSSRHANFNLFIATTRSNLGSPWSGLRGRLSPEMMNLVAPDFKERMVYVCGPDEFMKATKDLLEKIGYPMDNYHEESFGGAKKVKKVPATKLPEPTITAPVQVPDLRDVLRGIQSSTTATVELAAPVAPVPGITKTASGKIAIVFQKSGKEVAASADDTILDMADQEGVKIRNSCRAGSCGSCKKRKLEGDVRMGDYDTEALEAEEKAEGFILTCVSYPLGRVVIDA